MKVLVACEFSGVVREAFRKKGHDAWSCDLLPSEDGSQHHYQCDIKGILYNVGWDMLLAFPPCTDLASSGARWFHEKRANGSQQRSVEFFLMFTQTRINKVVIENPIGIMSSLFRKPDQIIQPWQFGHGETKATCLWLKGLPKLEPTNVVSGRYPRVHLATPGPDRWKERSRTYQGIADAMAEQWG